MEKYQPGDVQSGVDCKLKTKNRIAKTFARLTGRSRKEFEGLSISYV
jgi:hypothetical protein